MAGIGIDDQLRIGDVLRKRERIEGRNHDVPISVPDQRRLADGLQFRKSFSSHLSPFGQRRLLGLHRVWGAGRVDIVLAKMTSFPESPASSLPALRVGEKQIQEGFEPGLARIRIG